MSANHSEVIGAESKHHIRLEIQFLRAVAVLLVVLSHTGIPQFHGGFIGVDMFFVISGYVIGLTLLREMTSTGKVSILGFFQRRFFRIYPPLVVLVIFASFYAYLMLAFDKSQEYFIDQARAALLSYGNFFFMLNKIDYFLSNPNLTFFLHTWSLGIEEQFYFLVPIVIFLISIRSRQTSNLLVVRRWNIAFCTLFVISLASSIFLWAQRANFISENLQSLILFYSPLTRSWEFLLGILLAVNGFKGSIATSKYFSLFGSSLILISVIGSRTLDISQFLASSFAAIGTGMLIFGLMESRFSTWKIVTNKFVIYLGDRSYSIYLWHWLAVAIAEDLFHKIVSREKVILIVLSLVPAMLSYKYVEAPFKSFRHKARAVKTTSVLLLFTLPLISLFALEQLTHKSRKDYGNVFVQTFLKDCDYWNEICSTSSYKSSSAISKRILLLGDSHAYQLIPIFKTISEQSAIEVVTCVKICFEDNYPEILDGSFLGSQNFSLVVSMFKTNTGITTREYRAELAKEISEIAKMKNAQYLVVLDNPYFEKFKSPRRIKHPELTAIPRETQVLSEVVKQEWFLDSGEESIFYDPFSVMCSEIECQVESGNKALYVDDNHLSMVGVRLIEPSLIAMVDDILGK